MNKDYEDLIVLGEVFSRRLVTLLQARASVILNVA